MTSIRPTIQPYREPALNSVGFPVPLPEQAVTIS